MRNSKARIRVQHDGLVWPVNSGLTAPVASHAVVGVHGLFVGYWGFRFAMLGVCIGGQALEDAGKSLADRRARMLDTRPAMKKK